MLLFMALALIALVRARLDTKRLDLDRCRCFVTSDARPLGE
jgi:hypothetical protein